MLMLLIVTRILIGLLLFPFRQVSDVKNFRRQDFGKIRVYLDGQEVAYCYRFERYPLGFAVAHCYRRRDGRYVVDRIKHDIERETLYGFGEIVRC